MKTKDAITKLQARKAKLEEILKTCNKHSSREEKIQSYISEINELIALVGLIKKDIYIVKEERLNVSIQKADFASLEDEGNFFTLTLIQNYPYQDIYMLCLTPLAKC